MEDNWGESVLDRTWIGFAQGGGREIDERREGREGDKEGFEIEECAVRCAKDGRTGV